MYDKEIEALSSLRGELLVGGGREAIDTAIALMRSAEPKDEAAERERCRLLALGAQGFGPDTVAEVLEFACAHEDLATARAEIEQLKSTRTDGQLARERDDLSTKLTALIEAAERFADDVSSQWTTISVSKLSAAVASAKGESAPFRGSHWDVVENLANSVSTKAVAGSCGWFFSPARAEPEVALLRVENERLKRSWELEQRELKHAHDRLRALEAYTANLRAAAEDATVRLATFEPSDDRDALDNYERAAWDASKELRAALDAPMPAPTTERRETFDPAKVRALLVELRGWRLPIPAREAAAAVEASEVKP